MCCLIERYVLWLRRPENQGDVSRRIAIQKSEQEAQSFIQAHMGKGTDNIPAPIMQNTSPQGN
jgi:hypothetical protein